MTTAFDIHCNHKYFSLLKTLTRCSEDHKNNSTFIPYGLLQMTNTETYRLQAIFQNNFIASMAIVLIYGMTTTKMTDKVEKKVLLVAGISGVEKESSITWQRQIACSNKQFMQKQSKKINWSITSRSDTKDNRPRLQQTSWHHHERTSESNFSILYCSSTERNRTGTHNSKCVNSKAIKRPYIVLYNANNTFLKIRENRNFISNWTSNSRARNTVNRIG